jgi:arylsulfatase
MAIKYLRQLFILFASGIAGMAGNQSDAAPPNIILIMADDMGWSDLGCFGGEIATPNLDGLAAGGLRFTQFYNNGRCCPTRASLLTGLYPHQAGIGHMMENRGTDAYRGELNKRAVTIAEALKSVGYRNYMVGKWHVTGKVNPQSDHDKSNWPLQRGFDRMYGTIHGAGSFFDPNSLVRDNDLISPFADPQYKPDLFYYTDAINDHAVRYIRDHAEHQTDKPFFMYVAHTAPHWPMHAKEADIQKYRGKFDGGYDLIRAARVDRMRAMGLIDPMWQVAPQDGGDWSSVKNLEFEKRCMEVYAAMIDCEDQGIGRIIAELKSTGHYENTLIMFLQDNGGCAEPMGRGVKPAASATRAASPTLAALPDDYLQPAMIPKQTRDGYPMRQGYGVLPGAADTYMGYGRAWANVSNTPFREYKHWVHEGGISTPLIAHWPAGIGEPRPGQLVPQPAHLVDLMPTILELAGADYPQKYQGNDIQSAEGISLVPMFAGLDAKRESPLFWEHEGNRAVRDGQWKLVAKHRGKWELYDMLADRTEMRDLSDDHPQRVSEMSNQWQIWADRVGVLPWPPK